MSEQLSFTSKGIAGDLVRYVGSSGIRFQFKTGHSFYRQHKTPAGDYTDLRTTALTPDEIETEIVVDIHLFLDSGRTLPVLNRSFRQPMQKEIVVKGHQIVYRAVELPDGSISIGTYFAVP